MNKTIAILGIMVVFVVGTLAANPVVEAASGWKQAFEKLQNQINVIPQIKTVHLEPIVCGPLEVRGGVTTRVGWCPDRSGNEFWFIEDADVAENSVIIVTLDATDSFGPSCKVMQLLSEDGFLLRCSDRGSPNFRVALGTKLNYAIITP